MLLLTNSCFWSILNPVSKYSLKVLLQPMKMQRRIGNPVKIRDGTATVSVEVLHRRKPVIGRDPEKACRD